LEANSPSTLEKKKEGRGTLRKPHSRGGGELRVTENQGEKNNV